MYGSNECTFKKQRELIVSTGYKVFSNQKVLILKAGQEWYIRQQLSV
jgi:hypothetical protein